LVAAPCRPQGNKFRGTLEDLSDAKFERWVVTEMSIGQPKTHDDLARVPVLDNTGDGRGRTSSRLTCLAGLHVASLACASRHQNAAITGLRPLLANSNRRSSRQMRSFSITGLAQIPDDEPQGTGGPSVAAVRTRGSGTTRAGGAAGARRRRTTPRRSGHAEAVRCRSQAPATAATLSTFTGQRQEQTRGSAPPSDHGELQLLGCTAICSRPRSV
jgi:hypothetical protein